MSNESRNQTETTREDEARGEDADSRAEQERPMRQLWRAPQPGMTTRIPRPAPD
jgi:hypothetical protein